MAQFILLLHEDPSGLADLAPEEIQRVVEKYKAWRDQTAAEGKMVGGHKLTDDGGRLLSRGEEGLQVVDGPYAEAKELIGGLFLIEAADYEEAIRISESCPHLEFGRIELRQIDQMGE